MIAGRKGENLDPTCQQPEQIAMHLPFWQEKIEKNAARQRTPGKATSRVRALGEKICLHAGD
jgi:hypothetical protein